MTYNKNYVVLLAVAIVLVIAAFFAWNKSAKAPAGNESVSSPNIEIKDTSGTGQNTTTPTTPKPSGSKSTSGGHQYTKDGTLIIYYTQSGFQPKDVTVPIKQGIRFIDNADSAMMVASNPHPTHELYPALNQNKTVGRGGTFDVIMSDKGTWGYHNHLSPSHTGNITVQ